MKEKLEPPKGYVFVCVHCAEEIAIKLEDVGEVATNEAYELADELDRVLQVSGCDNRVPIMLRKQAQAIATLSDRIAELSKNVDELEEELLKAPQIKELSDEEILSFTVFKNSPYDVFVEYEKEDLIKFARAILKKASE